MIQWPNIGLYGEFEPCESGVLEAINSNFKILDTLVQMRVLDFVTSLPSNPSPGDRYILEDDLYQYSGSGSVIAVWNEDDNEWEFITPQAGYLSFVLSNSALYWFNGTDWVELPINPVQGPNSSQDGEVAVFDGTTGKWIKGSETFILGKSFTGTTSIYTEDLITDTIQSDLGHVEVKSQLHTEDKLSVEGELEFYQTDEDISGTDVEILNPTKVITRLTNSGLVSLAGIAPGKSKFIVLTNVTGSPVTIKQLTGTAGSQINTGVDGDLDIENNSSIMLYEDVNDNVWRVIGGTGSGSGGGGGSSVSWYVSDDYQAPHIVYRNINPSTGFNYTSKYFAFRHTGGQQYIFAKYKVSSKFKSGKNIIMKMGKVIVDSTDTSKNILFGGFVRVIRGGDNVLSLTIPQSNIISSEINVGATAGAILNLSTMGLTFGSSASGRTIQPNDELLIVLTRNYSLETASYEGDVFLSIDESNNAFIIEEDSNDFNP